MKLDKWINPAQIFTKTDSSIIINAEAGTDYFIDPASDFRASNGHLFVKKVNSDFSFQCKIKPNFTEQYDAGAIMYYVDDSHWIKFAFEKTDLGCSSVVSVVTDKLSDDSNGEIINSDSVYLKMISKNSVFGLYHSPDGSNWRMVRLFKFDPFDQEKGHIGIEAQSPVGKGCTIEFSEIFYSDETPTNMRTAI